MKISGLAAAAVAWLRLNPPGMNQNAVLITGGSSGIGRSLAKTFAAHGHPLVLVAASPSELADTQRLLRAEYSVPVRTIAKDLRSEYAAEEIFQEIVETGDEVNILVNNAGFGHRGRFWEIPFEEQIGMVRVNVEAVLRMTRTFLPPMLSRRSGRILNTASIAGFEPGPLLAVYHASKAFVLSFSEALATELEDSGITVTTLCPGATDTPFFLKADMLTTRAHNDGKLMPPDEVAQAAYEATMNGERLIVPGAANKATVFKRRLTTEESQAKANMDLYEENLF
jgi:short-subunit dehydrogenase